MVVNGPRAGVRREERPVAELEHVIDASRREVRDVEQDAALAQAGHRGDAGGGQPTARRLVGRPVGEVVPPPVRQ